MKTAELLASRLRSHRLTAPAASPVDAARHMLATQAQEFWGGRWALAVRSRGEPTLADLDAAFDRGDLVRAWTMRGTLHILRPDDLAWMLELTADRQQRQASAIHRAIGLDESHFSVAERALGPAFTGGGRLTRAEATEVLAGAGLDTADMRGAHLLAGLAHRGFLCWGPVVPRPGGPTREQYLVRTDEWIASSSAPADPLAEYFVRFVDGHGPAGLRDFSWWAGLPLGVARDAAERAQARVARIDDDLYRSASVPRRSPAASDVLALPPYEEYFLSYDDRSVACSPEFLARIGPSLNGIVRPIIVADGVVRGVWAHSMALGRYDRRPAVELFDRQTDEVADDRVEQALSRFLHFVGA